MLVLNEEQKAKKAAYQKAWREVNREKVNARCKAYRETNLEKLRAKNKVYREANAEKVRAKSKLYHEVNREKENARCKAWSDNLKDLYVAKVLCLPVTQVPPELLQAKREQLTLRRAIKYLNNTLSEVNSQAAGL